MDKESLKRRLREAESERDILLHQLTDAVKNSAEEMKRLAEHYKKKMEKTTKL